MTIQQLRCFIVVAETLKFTTAAERLHISQPSLSYSISELEKELGIPLFKRVNNMIRITQYGEALLPYVKVALDNIEAITVKAYELLDPATGTVNLGNIYSISFDFVPRILELFYADKENGQVTISIFQGVNRVLMDKLMDGSLDLVISGKSQSSEVHSRYLFTQELKYVVPADHPLAGRKEVSLADVGSEGLISLGEGSNITGHIDRCFKARGLQPNFVLHVAECSAMGAFISSNMATAIAPIVPSLSSNSVRVIPFTEEDRQLLGRKVYLQWGKNKYLPPPARAFRDFIIDEFGN